MKTKSRGRRAAAFALAILLTAGLGACSPKEKALSPDTVTSNPGKWYTLTEEYDLDEGVRFDIDRDGKAERLPLEEYYRTFFGEGAEEYMRENVQGSRVGAVSPDGKDILIGKCEEDYSELFAVRDGKFEEVFSTGCDLSDEQTVFSGNSLTVRQAFSLPVSGEVFVTWERGEDGIYVWPEGKIYEYIDPPKVTTKDSFYVYPEPDVSSAPASVLRPQEVTVLKTDLGMSRGKQWLKIGLDTAWVMGGLTTFLYVEGADGTKGWLPVSDAIPNVDGKMVDYPTYWDE